MGKGVYQLQLLFDDIDHKKAKLREIKADIKAEIEASPEWGKIVEDKDRLKNRIKDVKDRVKQQMSGDFEEVRDMSKELKDEQVRFRDQALPLLLAGKPVTVKGGDGKEYVARLEVKLTAVEDEKLEEEQGEAHEKELAEADEMAEA